MAVQSLATCPALLGPWPTSGVITASRGKRLKSRPPTTAHARHAAGTAQRPAHNGPAPRQRWPPASNSQNVAQCTADSAQKRECRRFEPGFHLFEGPNQRCGLRLICGCATMAELME